ncbi:MAG: hypothetical protein KJ023_14165 [Burkholderiaceae bacterium]|nr:hypothetical protein [Burkholderiaceae bacterium]
MHRVVRAFVVWVMVIAMPAQGLAASSMLSCGPGHEHMARAFALAMSAGGAGHDTAAAAHDKHAHAAPQGSAAGHEDRAAPHAAAAGAGNDVGDNAGPFAPQGGSGCSACADCCSVLALPVDAMLPEPVGPLHPLRAAPAPRVASYPSDTPDRPPRTGHA